MNPTTELWVDALDFREKGGWKEDTQFVHLMGSGYLMAADEPGIPVEDAVISVQKEYTRIMEIRAEKVSE